ncbi:nucleotide-binding universal stress UspA family protein [Actinoplanes tereljensis]|uniref:Universal stress protein A n=1 Tax=Paractinoplanes tereljensis TaxID=571912 RepID=A0A919TXF6_9ACTN|nr:universal stress protein [Actinoplanes tereljensis]GIF24170.1 universal stress protein A [Actinoplanes tereljensis]
MGFELGTDGPGAIVVGVDGSPTSMRAAAYAAGLARRQHTRLIAVYARALPTTLLTIADHSGMAVNAVLEAQDDLERQLRAEIHGWGANSEVIIRQGDPMTVLAEVAKETRADALIVGSSASFGHRIAGSLAIRLVRYGKWPVTVVP